MNANRSIAIRVRASWRALASLFVLACLGPAVFAQFTSPTIWPAGATPTGMVSGDFNNDGLLDVAVANLKTSSVSVLLNTGKCQFQTPMASQAFASPLNLAAGDFNLDGNLDLVTAHPQYNTIAILLGNGAGKFSQGASYFTKRSPNGLAVADLNGDNRLDIAVTCWGNLGDNNTVSVFPGYGTGAFGAPQHFITEYGPRSVAVGDFNLDNILDLAVATTGPAFQVPGQPVKDGQVSILPGLGGGLFGPKTDYKTGKRPTHIIAADFDHNGYLDLATADGGSSVHSASVLINDTTGAFAVTVYPVSDQPSSVTAGDYDNDGALDLAVSRYQNTNIAVLPGKGDGTFGFANEFDVNGKSQYRAVTEDFNQDGLPDIAVTNSGGDNVALLCNVGQAFKLLRNETDKPPSPRQEPRARPDLVAKAALCPGPECDPNLPSPGGDGHVQFRIKNKGYAAANSFHYKLVVWKDGVVLHETPAGLLSLGAGQEWIFASIPFTVGGITNIEARITADLYNTVAEWNELNNFDLAEGKFAKATQPSGPPIIVVIQPKTIRQ